MKYIDPRFVILIFGYVFLSETVSLWINPPLARALSAFASMLIIYWIPSRLKINSVDWIGSAIMTAIIIYLVNADFPIAFTLMLLAIFLLSYFKR